MKSQIELYKENIRIINRIAKQYSKKYKIDFSDLLAQSNLIFCEAYKNYNVNKKNSFFTYLYHCLHFGLNKYIKKTYFIQNIKFKKLCINIDPTKINCFVDSNYDRIEFFDHIEELSKDAQIVFLFIFEDKKYIQTMKMTKKSIKQHLRKAYAWKNKRIEDVFNELSLFLEY